MSSQPNQAPNQAPPPGTPTGYPPFLQSGMPGRDPREKSPILAGILSCMPGLGQIYVGYYQRGFTHALIVAGCITMLSRGVRGMEPLFGLFLAFFWLYNIIDASRKASLFNQALAGGEDVQLPADFTAPSMRGSLAGGVILIVVGFIFLLHTRFDVSMEWLADWWPVAPILFGGYLVYKAIQEKNAPATEDSRTD